MKDPGRLSGLAFAILMLQGFPGRSEAQQFECGEVPETACAYLNLALAAWPQVAEQFGADFGPESVTYYGNRSAIPEVSNGLRSMENQVFAAFDHNEKTVKLFNSDDVDPTLKERWASEFARLIEASQHVAEIVWKSPSEEFSTYAFLSDQWPYVIDPILSSVVIEEESNSCLHKRLRWLWGSTRGEIIIDLVAVSTQQGLLCPRVIEAWMNLGDAKAVATEPIVSGNSCLATFESLGLHRLAQ